MLNIFYSWQSDSPSSSNRSLIKNALNKAIKSLNKNSEDIKIEMRIDTATDNLSGSPDIAASIFEKISNSHIFICDATIINPLSPLEKIALPFYQKNKRLTPNPNVLIELGFAASYLGWDKIICVVNTSQSRLEDLPFDIRGRRMCQYKYPDKLKSEKSKIQDNLANHIKSQLMDIISRMDNIKSPDLITSILSNKFIECTNYLGVFLNYFLENKLGHKKAEDVVNESICTVSQNFDLSAIEEIVKIFENKDINELSNAVTESGKNLSWKEFMITAFKRISSECENLLSKYGSSGNPELIVKLERIKDISVNMINFINSNDSQYMREIYSEEVRRKVFATSWLKPYFLEVIETRILAIKYLESSEIKVKSQPKVLPGENLKTNPNSQY
ncbi:hypothetical protein B6N60_00526 [Richelia sinica FACHB-800]|uniref:CD-NTase-associated protein 12/Pycsar effector protein TIR domain-containing protein n=1 Tax=Richelia sinica FACHB-800 TaxID=1357546 RepID=A0A975T5J9_9NOST|nr:hypothetical protein [Richelia sinica]MBD2662998.1 hypothetical protein [Richelia sinica FACHB-800]QXE21848.1 hypothetical protein B6N60_00526 [Richelia sinica FACHB-800]